MGRSAARPRRVLVAAFLLPETIEFQQEVIDHVQDLSTPSPAPKESPDGGSAPSTEALAEVLSSSLTAAVNKEAAMMRVFADMPSQKSAFPASARHSSQPGPKDRVNMAELMADATRTNEPHSVPVSTSASQVHSPAATDLESQPARPNTVSSSLSDHGRKAHAEPEGAVPSRAGAVSPRMRTPTLALGSAPLSNAALPSIISDLATKSQQQTRAPTPTQSDFPTKPSVARTTAAGTSRLMMTGLNVRERSKSVEGLGATEHEHYSTPPLDTSSPMLASGHRRSADGTPPSRALPRPAAPKDQHAGRWAPSAARACPRDDAIHRRFSVPRRSSKPLRPGAYGASAVTSDEWTFEFVPNTNANYGLINAIHSQEALSDAVVYFGTLGIEMDAVPAAVRERIDADAAAEHHMVPVWMRDQEYVQSYHQYCKQVLWPTLHYTLPTAKGLEMETASFKAYYEVNRKFAERIAAEYREGDLVWVHDYHLLLVPGLLREMLPRAPIGLFVHVAFPSSEIFRCLSRRRELLLGMLGADLVGFQTHNFCRHFRQTANRTLDAVVTPRGVQLKRSFVTVAPFPIGIDVAMLDRRHAQPEVAEWIERLQERFAGKSVIVGRDKLDWIKGVREKLIGFEVFLDTHPEWVGRVVLVQVALATVQDGTEAGVVSDLAARINHKHGSLTYQPIVFLYVQEITFSQYLALLSIADAFMATSLREGMNLTTHEYIMAQRARHRPLILSEFTGTYSALRACIGVNPFNPQQVAAAIHQALVMPRDEVDARWHDLHRTVMSQTAQHWVASVLSQLERAHARQPCMETLFTPELDLAQMQPEWRAAKSRLVLLDLENTLLRERPRDMHQHGFSLPPALIDMLRRLVDDTRTYVYVLSSRSTADLDLLANAVPNLGLVAENGCYVRHGVSKGSVEWSSLVDGFRVDWREPVLEILEYFTERTPGSWIEPRATAIAWYFCEGTSEDDTAWARRQASEVQGLISDSLGERFSLRILDQDTHFIIMPKNVGRLSAVQYVLALDSMGTLPLHDPSSRKGMFEFILHIGQDEALIAYFNDLDLPFAPRTCTTAEPGTIVSSIAAFQLPPYGPVHEALQAMVDFRLRDLKWGRPATLDV